MKALSLCVLVEVQALLWRLRDENGQDLVEYALVIAVVCLGIIAGMNTLANGINTAMNTLGTSLNSAVA